MRREPGPRRWLAIVASLVSALALTLAQQSAQWGAGRNPLLFLRTDYWHDQLGYLAIAADVANGHFDLTEPVTMTGVSHYPRLYYSAVGFIARALGLSTVMSWNLVSLILQFAAAFTIGLVAANLSRRWWVALLAPLPFLTGVFAYVAHPGAWFTDLQAHAVLWGPFGALFSNNGETAGLSLGVIVLACLAWAWTPVVRRWVRIVVTIVGSAAVGILSAFQTYSFLSMTYLLAFGAAIAGIVLARRRLATGLASVALIAAVFVVGPLLAEHIGQLPTLIFGMVPAVPGLIVAIVRSRGVVAYAAIAAVAAASPQVLYTLFGILQGDPFLTYRVASNHRLGIVSWEALAGASVVLVALIVGMIMSLKVKDPLAIAVSGAALAALPLLALNDLWGANAEPYRFWIEGMLLGGALAFLGLARLSGLVFARRPETASTPRGPIPLPIRGTAREAINTSRRARAIFAAALLTIGVLWAASLPDWINSLRDPQLQAVWDPSTPRESAITDLARQASANPADGLVTTELCIDNRTTKVTSGAPVANFHVGMAWPDLMAATGGIMAARNSGRLDFPAMAATDTRWVLTDSSCFTDWETEYVGEMTEVDSRSYALAPGEQIRFGTETDGTITLWRVDAQSTTQP